MGAGTMLLSSLFVRPVFTLCLVMLVSGWANAQANAQSSSNSAGAGTDSFLLFSDVHFNPFADPSLVPALASSDVSSWKGILASSKNTSASSYGRDSNYALFESALNDMSARAGNVSTIIYPGDVLSHDFNQFYVAITKDKSQAGLDSFIQKTADFFVQEVHEHFPKSTVLIAIGNNDSALGNFGSKPGDPYLSGTTPAISKNFFTNDADRASFAAGYSQGGYYAVSPNGPTGQKFIVVNAINWTSQGTDPAAGAMELSWFQSELADSAQNNQKVWVVSHIPPGASSPDSEGTYGSGPAGKASYQGNLTNSFNDAFIGLELFYDKTIAATFTGHTHRDDFRLLTASDGSGASEMVRISPAITPISGSNPSYRIVSYNTQNYSLIDETTYTLNLGSSSPAWSREYNYVQTYGQALSTPQGWQAVYAGILTNPALQSAYVNYSNGNAASINNITPANAPAYLLAPGFTTQESYNAAAALLPK